MPTTVSTHPARRLAAAAAVTLLAAGGLAACSDKKDDSSATTAQDSSATTVADESGDGASSGSNDAEYIDVCTVITDAEVSAIAGNPVVKEDSPGGGCSFDPEDPANPSIGFMSTDAADDTTDGTFNETRYGTFAVLTGAEREDIDLGDRATVGVGTSPGGSSSAGAGIVQVGPTIVAATVTQAVDMDAAAVEAMTLQATELAASKLTS